MGFALNQTIENYEVLGIIDKPRAGVTYKVRNLTTGVLEALRTLPGATAGDPEATERLLREIRVHARLLHPNIVTFHHAQQVDGNLLMTTEFVEGHSLAELCAHGPLPPAEAIKSITALLSGLEQAHKLGIVHRGITAEHVVVTPEGVTKLGGFGLAKPASDANLTKVGAVMGDPHYISPEQIMGLNALDGRSDLYSVGVLLYQTLTGKVPFEGCNDFDILAAQVSSEPRAPRALNPAIAPEFEAIILKALKKDPNARFATAGDFRAALTANAAELAKPPAPFAETPAPSVVAAPTVVSAPDVTVTQPQAVAPDVLLQYGAQKVPLAPLVFGFLVLAVALVILTLAAMH